jgi:ZIP family zinc transporter
MSFADLQKLAPTVKWDTYFQSVGIGKVDSLVVSQPKYLQTVETILKDNQVEDWKAYMRWTALRGSAGLLSTDIENANFDFYGKTLTGAVKQRPAEERALGALFIFGLDKVLPHMHINFKETEGIKSPWQRTTLLVLAITLHNIPEGLAVGVLFGGVAAGIPEASIAGAVTLAIGIGIQNFPEGIAVSMPLRRMGMSRRKSFMYGQSSALVEPIFGVLGAVAVTFFTPILPYALAFAAGAMIFVVVEEVIPETQQDKNTDIATLGFIGGFIVMMTLDVALG